MKIYKNGSHIIISLDEFLELIERDAFDQVLEWLDKFEGEVEQEVEFIPLDLDESGQLKKDDDYEIEDLFDLIHKEIQDVLNSYSALQDQKFEEVIKKNSSHSKIKKDEDLTEEDRKVMRILARFKET